MHDLSDLPALLPMNHNPINNDSLLYYHPCGLREEILTSLRVNLFLELSIVRYDARQKPAVLQKKNNELALKLISHCASCKSCCHAATRFGNMLEAFYQEGVPRA